MGDELIAAGIFSELKLLALCGSERVGSRFKLSFTMHTHLAYSCRHCATGLGLPGVDPATCFPPVKSVQSSLNQCLHIACSV